jgi:hypothetical protein
MFEEPILAGSDAHAPGHAHFTPSTFLTNIYIFEGKKKRCLLKTNPYRTFTHGAVGR